MVKAMINISEQANQVLNIVKAKENLKDKSEAIDFVVMAYGDDILERKLKPEFIERMKRIEKQKAIKFKSIEELRKKIENA